MEQTKYDIFISYKRKSLPTANNLYYRLTVRGYSTFFDLEEMGRDNFNMQLLNYIENAKDVFVILEEGSLDACKEDDWEKDWFCHEIAFALEKKKNIIPILIGNYKMPSEEFFPDRLKELSLKNAPEFNFSFFEAYLDKLMEKEFLLSKPNLKEKATSIFKFYSDEKCQVFKEGKLVCSLEGESDTPYYLPVPRKGEYRFKAKNEWDGEKIITASIGPVEEKIIEIKWNDYTVVNTAPPKRKSGIQKIITFFVYCLFAIGGGFIIAAVKDMVETKQKSFSYEGTSVLLVEDKNELNTFQDTNGKWGFINSSGEIVIPCKWLDVRGFSEGLAAVQDTNEKWGFINKSGNVVIPCKWKRVSQFFLNGYAGVQDVSGKWGFINKSSELVIPCKWNNIYYFYDGLAKVQDSSGKWGFINKSGDLVIPCKWKNVHVISDGFAAVQNDSGRWGVFNQFGDMLIPCKWHDISYFSQDFAIIQDLDDKYGIINKFGKITIPIVWDYIGSLKEGLAIVQDSLGKWGFINETGDVMISCKWKAVENFSDGLARVKNDNGKCGYINKVGEEVVQCRWKKIHFFIEDYAAVQDVSGKWGFINKSDELVIPCKWNTALDFCEGLAIVKGDNGKFGFINKSGDLVIPCKWNAAMDFREGLAVVKGDNGKFGYVDKTGMLIISCMWKSATSFGNKGYTSIVEDEDGHVYTIDRTGKVLRVASQDFFKRSGNDLGKRRRIFD